jgi:hypothetical protein
MAIRITADYKIKPATPYKSVITPSSLYKGNCARCTWLSYWHNFSIPANLALQQQMSRIQEASFDGVTNESISSILPKGWAVLHKGKFASRPIHVNGQETRWKFYGELDLLSKNEDGSFSIIDGKVSMKKDEEGLIDSYWTQLEAYVYMLEHPEIGDPIKIDSIGLLQWRITGDVIEQDGSRGFAVEERYIPVNRRVAEFDVFMARFIGIIEGDYPDASSTCLDCKFLTEIGFYQ